MNGVPLADFQDVTAAITRRDDRCAAWVARGTVHEARLQHGRKLACAPGTTPRAAFPAEDPSGNRPTGTPMTWRMT